MARRTWGSKKVTSMDYQSLSNDYVMHAVKREKSLIFERAEGSRLWDIQGRVYLDTMSGSAGPAMVGHAHPAVPGGGGASTGQAPLHQHSAR